MVGPNFTAQEETQLFADLQQIDARRQNFNTTANPVAARQIGDFARSHPYAAPGTVLAVGKAVAENKMSYEQANNFLIETSKTAMDKPDPPKENKSWWDRNVASKIKTVSRYTMAGLNFVPQTAVGAAAQIFDENKDIDGWFISTDLGSLIENDKVAGEGYFIGGKAHELQAERAKRYRGEIDGHAFTIGRGLAHVLTQPGSKEYNILSGLVDAAVAIAVPSVPGTQVIKGATKGLSAKTGLRTVAGLSDFESVAINVAKVPGFLRSRSGTSVIKRISEIDNIDDAMKTFDSVGDAKFWVDIVDKADEARKLGDNTVILKYLEDTLGLTGPRTIDSINISRFDDVQRAMVGRTSRIARYMAAVPGNHVLLQGGNVRDIASSVKNLNNYLKLLKNVTFEDRVNMVSRYAKSLTGDSSEAYDVAREFQTIFKESMAALDVPEGAIDQLYGGIKDFTQNKLVYGASDNDGKSTIFGTKIFLTDGKFVDAPLLTAGNTSEILNSLSMMLPDVRQVRRLNSDFGWIFGKTNVMGKTILPKKQAFQEFKKLRSVKKNKNGSYTIDGVERTLDERNELILSAKSTYNDSLKFTEDYGKLRIPFSALEFAQQKLWRPTTLLTGGYVVRNLSDSAIRLSSTAGYRGGIYHPVEWIQIAMKKKFRGDVIGNKFVSDPEKLLLGTMNEYTESINVGLREMDPINVAKHEKANQHWETVTRDSDISGQMLADGVMNETSLLGDDFVTQQLALGLNPQEVVDLLLDRSPASTRYLKDIEAMWKNKTFKDPETGENFVGSIDMFDAKGVLTPNGVENVKFYVQQYGAGRLSHYTKDNEVLRLAVAQGKYVDEEGKLKDIYELDKNDVRKGYSKGFQKKIRELVNDPTVELAKTYKRRINFKDIESRNKSGIANSDVLQRYDKVVDYFFSSLYPKRSAYLMQSVAFRQNYYKQVGNLFSELDESSFGTLLNQLKKAAKEDKKLFDKQWLDSWVGDKDLSKKILATEGNTTALKGRLTLTELDSYAKGYSLDETKKLFYNASEKSNFADIISIIAPFGTAWAEVMKSWTKIALTNPETVKRAGVTVRGLQNADPDNDGKGFFWKDPVTGEQVFNYPFNKQLGALKSYFGVLGTATGAVGGGLPGAAIGLGVGLGLGQLAESTVGEVPGTTLFAPVKTLTMGFNIVPGVGPFVQIAASKILGQIPEGDAVLRFIAPYGEPDLTLFPAWGKKFAAALSNPQNNQLLGDLIVDTMKVLETTGEYELSESSEKERLYNDSVGRARSLLLLRSLGQFIGPSRPDVEFKISTEDGDMFGNELAKAFRTMQEEDYDTAVETFLNTFGDDAFLYIAGKTKSVVGGLDSSTKFGNFERSNSDLFSTYPDVAGYLAPVGTNFDFQVWVRQLTSGSRERLRPRDLVEVAQATVGKALYRNVLRGFGPDISAEQKETLKGIRNLLQKEYPGFATSPVDVNRLKAELIDLQKAVNDPLTEDNPIAIAGKLYFDARDQALLEANRRGLSTLGGKAVSDLRVMLRGVGDLLIKQYPEFERLYDRVLFNEIDVDFGDTP